MVLGGLLLVSGLILFIVFRAANHVPEFYQQAIVLSPDQQRQFRDELQEQFRELKTDVARKQRFEIALSEQQINGWLATTLMEQYADKLPAGMRDPRISIQEGEVRIGCRYQKGGIDSVIWLIADVELTDQTNVLEIRLRGLKAGRIPFSLEQFQARITSALSRADLKVSWVDGTADLTAQVQLPDQFKGLETKTVQFEKIDLQEGSLLLSGRTGK